jgi:hypothetical protein
MHAYLKRPQHKPAIAAGRPISDRIDNRSAATAQRRLQATASDSPQARQLRAIREVATSAVMQRQIADVVHTLPQNILALATTYNLLGDETTVGARINSLSQVEHAVYAWLTANKAPDMSLVPGAAAVRHLMDTTKAERSRIVARSINVSQDHLGEGAIPIAGFAALQPEEQLEVRAMWRGLIEGTGRIQIGETDTDNQEVHAGFRMKTLVEFSRLLEGRFGRSIVKDINASARQVVIEPFHMENADDKSFAANPSTVDAEHLTKLDAPPAEEVRVHYPETVITDLTEMQRLRLFNQLKATVEGQLGVRLVDGGATTYYRFGAGSNVKVTMPSDLPDDSQHNESRLADAAGNELAAPVFLNLGHELGHAIHMQRGTATRNAEAPGFFETRADQSAYRGDREEYVNIEGNENALRAEHGLGERKGHVNIPALQRAQMEREINPWFTWLRQMGPLSNLPVYVAIQRELTAMDRRISTEWLNPATLPALRRDFAALPATIRTMQLDYLRDNFVRHIEEEKKLMMLSLFRLRFSFPTGVDIPQMVLAADIEFDYEKTQAQAAVRGNTLAQYLGAIPAQRLDYSNAKFLPKLDSIREGVAEHGNQENVAALGRLTALIDTFNRVNWLPPG